MTKTEFLSASLPYGVKVAFSNSTFDVMGVGLIGGDHVIGLKPFMSVTSCLQLEYCYPIIRPISDLTKECVQADYNDGKPFIPIVELAKIEFGDISVIETKSKKNISGIRFLDEDSDTCVLAYHYETSSFGAHVERLEKTENEFINVYYQLQLFQHLLKWHFDLITEDCEKVYVTEDFNPYK